MFRERVFPILTGHTLVWIAYELDECISVRSSSLGHKAVACHRGMQPIGIDESIGMEFSPELIVKLSLSSQSRELSLIHI